MTDPTFHAALDSAKRLHQAGRIQDAQSLYRQILSRQPDHPDALHLLGVIQFQQGQPDAAMELIRRAIAVDPGRAEFHCNLGVVLADVGRDPDAIVAFQHALDLRPAYPEAHHNLGNSLREIGWIDQAIAHFRQALAIQPGDTDSHDNLLYAMHYHPDYDAAALLREHLEWNRRHARPLAAHIQPHANDRDPDRRLRIGYVSPDLRVHPVGRFLLPLFARHDHQRFEIVCFYNAAVEDDVTRYLRGHADRWHDISAMSDEEAAELIRREQIDILVDLSLHMAHNRLLVFARKPAPVQVTYLAYCGTSGLETMDYRLTDPYLDPEGMDESVYTEKSVRLPRTYWCYEPCIRDVAVKAPPAGQGGGVTFGCFNNYCKVSRATWEAWGRLLQAVPGSRLMVCCPLGAHREQVRGELAAAGVDPQRLIFAAKVPMVEYLERYHEVDIGLDPFPYGGGTTTCDALWMGVPVVSLRGRTAVGRGGVSILSNLGLAELIAENTDQYVAIAKALAEDLPRLAELRGGLRQRMRRSPLMDGEQFARDVESAYRQMWRRWCTPGGGES